MTWRITHPNFTMTGTGQTPRVYDDVVVVTPPPVPPPVNPPPVDNTPFVWPPEYTAQVDYAARYVWSWPVNGDQNAYAYQAGTGNPVGWQHHNAGIIQSGRFMGLRLWAPFGTRGSLLRNILSGNA